MQYRIHIPRLNQIQAGYQKAPGQVRKELSNAIAKSTLIVEGAAIREAPVDTGMLRGRMTRTITPIRGSVYTTVDYALPVHEGTKPRTITPKKKKVLAWKKGGKWHFAKKVRHPGTKANPFFTRAFQKSKDRIQREFDKAAENIVKFIAKQ